MPRLACFHRELLIQCACRMFRFVTEYPDPTFGWLRSAGTRVVSLRSTDLFLGFEQTEMANLPEFGTVRHA
jgi:hypothetical protein